MKIDKIIFSTSDGPEYSPFWNLQSLIWSSMGIEPICLIWGDRSKTNLSEKYGKVIEKKFIPGLPEVIQITWSKFDFPKTEPDTTWMIGDIDMLPLQRKYFIDQIKDDGDDWYLHLNAGGISVPRRGKLDAWLTEGPVTHHIERGSKDTGADLPGHYHVSKGKNFNNIYNLDISFEDQIKRLTESHRYGYGISDGRPREDAKTDPTWYYWCAEENYSSEKLWEAVKQNKITFKGYCYNNSNFGNRVDRSHWNETEKNYLYNPEEISSGKKVDIHCARPYDKQQAALLEIVQLSGVLNK